ncbi:MAG: sulfatase [Thermoanaerobaculia bacterium]
MRQAARLVALLLLSGAGCHRPEEPRSQSLASVTRNVKVDWPAGCEPPNWRARPADDLLAPPPDAPQSLRRLRLGEAFGRDERVAYLAPAGSRYRFELEVPRSADLHLAIGRVSQGEEGSPLTLRARVSDGSGEGTTLVEKTLAFGAPETWTELAFDTSRWGGRSVVLELTAEGDDPAASCGERLAGWAVPRFVARNATGEKRLNVIWISVDTLRADRLGSYGGLRPVSPELDRLAAGGVRFAWAISQAPWTKPSHRSMLTGLYPLSRDGLEAPYVGSLFHESGYRTFALTGAGQVDSSFGFDRGFEIYRLDDWIHDPGTMLSWIDERVDAPFFLFLHTYEAHEPYTHDEFARALPGGRLAGEYSKKIHNQLRGHLSDEEKEYVRALYDGDIAYTDRGLGRLFRDLERRGLLETTMVLVTSDHGEQLWDHGTWGHGQTLHDHQIHVPLILHLPKSLGLRTGRVESEQVELIDLYPTVLDLAGIAVEGQIQGRSLRPLLEEKGPLPARQAFAESTNIKSFEKRALRTPRYKFVLWESRRSRRSAVERYELYDLRADPGELVDLSERFPEQVARLRDEVKKRVVNADPHRDEEVPAEVDAELRKQLEALGYIGN